MGFLLKGLFFLSIVLLFFQAFGFFVPNTGACFCFEVISISCLYLLFLSVYRFKVIKLLKNCLKYKFFKFYTALLLYIVFTTILLSFFGFYTASKSFYVFKYIKLLIPMILIFFLPILGLVFHISLKKIIKIIYLTIYFVLLFGLLQYIIFLFEIPILYNLIDIVTNLRIIYEDLNECKVMLRVYSTFFEPSAFGQFIFIVLPIINSIYKTKYKIVNHPILNIILKKTIIPLTIFDIIATKSPIYLVLCFIEIFVLFLIDNFKYIKKYLFIYSIVFILIFSGLFSLSKTDMFNEVSNNSYLGRIKTTIETFSDPYEFSKKEPSLATRLYFYANQVEVFKRFPLFGCGIGNIDKYALITFGSTNNLVPTWENMNDYKKADKLLPQAYSLVYTSLAEYGLIGFILLFLFWYQAFAQINKNIKYLDGLIKDFSVGIQGSLVSIAIISFYNLNRENYTIWLILGFVLAINIYIKERMQRV